ncbi:MAG: sigma-70 family RNA polymerase sigma factor [Acidobacteria bacterium]|nr:sigma-70 family RNA polymerase sigma factor [Acidobacteriota bacterium]
MSAPDTPDHVHSSVDHLFRHRAGQMVASLTRIFGLQHIDLVEDAVQDALVRALRLWPYEGTPRNPTAWLIQVAKNRLLDRLRRQSLWHQKQPEAERSMSALREAAADSGPAFALEVRDDQLRMIFTCCHPAIPRESQIALTAKTVGGFSTAEIARAFLCREATIAQRLVRAKRKLKQRAVKLEMPQPEELAKRLDPVLEVRYLRFNEGYSALEGEDLVRTDLCHEAIRLVELLAAHPAAAAPRVHALAALFFFQAARLPARADAAGDLLLLDEQDRSVWDREMLRRGLRHLESSASGSQLSSYHLQAEIAACHALATSLESTDWSKILSCYDDLLALDPSPVVALNRTVALAKVEGPEAGLRALDELAEDRSLRRYHPLYATRGELLGQLGRTRESVACYRQALALTSSEPVRRFLEKKLNAN